VEEPGKTNAAVVTTTGEGRRPNQKPEGIDRHVRTRKGGQNSPTCERCHRHTHILCECEALACFRLYHLGKYFMEPSDYFDAFT
jgi:hypothetical protein